MSDNIDVRKAVKADGTQVGILTPEHAVYAKDGTRLDTTLELIRTGKTLGGNSITAKQIAAGAVIAEKIATYAVTEEKLASNSVTNAKIADKAVTNAKIADGTITNLKLADAIYESGVYVPGTASVTNEKIADGTITGDKLSPFAVKDKNLADNTITNDKIADKTITNDKLAGEISNDKLAGGITNDKLAGEISNDKLAGGITNDKLAGGIDGSKIADNTIDADAKVVNNTVDGAKIKDNSIDASTKIKDKSIDASKIKDATIESAKLMDSSVTTEKLALGAITDDKIADGALLTFETEQSEKLDELAQDVNTRCVDFVYEEAFSSGTKEILCGYNPNDVVTIIVTNNTMTAGYFTIGGLSTNGEQSERTTQIINGGESLTLNYTEVYAGNGYYCTNIGNLSCTFKVKKQNPKITSLGVKVDTLEAEITTKAEESDVTSLKEEVADVNSRCVDIVYEESFSSGTKEILCGYNPNDVVTIIVTNNTTTAGYFTIGGLSAIGEQSERTTQIINGGESLELNYTEIYSGKGYYCTSVNNVGCVFKVKKQNPKITDITTAATTLSGRVGTLETEVKEIEEELNADTITVKSSVSSMETITLEADAGAYLLSITPCVNDAYGSFDFLNASSISLANDVNGNDENERKTIPNRLFTAGVVYEKRLYFNTACATLNITNPNGTIFAVTLKKLEGSKDYDLIVAEDGSGQLTDLYDAIKWVGDTQALHKTIFVKPGTYNMPELNFNTNTYRDYRNLSIIGADKNSVVVKNTDGAYSAAEYDNAPLQLSGNVTLKNLTIISTGDDYSRSSGGATAYCLHVDSMAHEGDVFEIDNCDFYNNHYAALALCPNKGQTIRVKNSHAVSEGMSAATSTWHGVIISHDNNNGDGTGTGKLEFVNNVLESDGNAMAVTSNYFAIDTEFIGNAVFIGSGKAVKTFTGDVTLNSKSCMNNVLDLNS